MTTQMLPSTMAQIPSTMAQIPSTMAQIPSQPMYYPQMPQPYYPPINPQIGSNGTSVLDFVNIIKGIVVLCVLGIVFYGLYQMYMLFSQLGGPLGDLLNAAKGPLDVASQPLKDAKPLLGGIFGSDVAGLLKGNGALKVAQPLTAILNAKTYTPKGTLNLFKNIGNKATFGVAGKIASLF
jgi:hypothetical protein